MQSLQQQQQGPAKLLRKYGCGRLQGQSLIHIPYPASRTRGTGAYPARGGRAGRAWAGSRPGRGAAAPTVLVATLHGCCFWSFFSASLSLLHQPSPPPSSTSPLSLRLPSPVPRSSRCSSPSPSASLFLLRLLSCPASESVVNHRGACWPLFRRGNLCFRRSGAEDLAAFGPCGCGRAVFMFL